MMSGIMKSRAAGLIVIIVIYVLAAVFGVTVFLNLTGFYILVALLLSDLSATIFIWFIGLVLHNSSVYDPYWSVAPIIMAPLLAGYLGKFNMGVLLLLSVILFWGIRLTIHWGNTFKGLGFQDWRYTQLKDNNPKFWFVINLFGIHIFPTIVVFLVMVPAYLFMMDTIALDFGIVPGMCLSLLGIILQSASDIQMKHFRQSALGTGNVNQTGLWQYIRHPNYLGEILMWWGVFLMLYLRHPEFWYTLIGPLINTLMFLFISIPLMEKRQLRSKQGYSDYMDHTGMLLPHIQFNRIVARLREKR